MHVLIRTAWEAGGLFAAGILFLIVLLRRYAVTGPRPTRAAARNYRRKPAPRRG